MRGHEQSPKMLIIAGMDNTRSLKAQDDKSNPNASIIDHHNAGNRDRLIARHFETGRGRTIYNHPDLQRRYLQDPME